MNVHELPLISFTILAQMCVGAFVILGLIQVIGPRLYHLSDAERRGAAPAATDDAATTSSAATSSAASSEPTNPIARLLKRFGLDYVPATNVLDKLTDPALFAIGPILVLGLLGSMLHLGNPFNALNTFRHLGSSWLSREILFGVGFAAAGFVFSFLQWKKIGSPRLRQALGVITALIGLGLVYVMSMVYASLPTVPFWHLWTTPATFFVTTFTLGALAVGAGLLTVTMWRRRRLGGRDDVIDDRTQVMLQRTVEILAVAIVALAIAQIVLLILQLTTMGADPAMPEASRAAFYNNWFLARILLLMIGACLLGFLMYRFAAAHRSLPTLATVATCAFVVVLASEVLGRSLFYDAMTRIGM